MAISWHEMWRLAGSSAVAGVWRGNAMAAAKLSLAESSSLSNLNGSTGKLTG